MENEDRIDNIIGLLCGLDKYSYLLSKLYFNKRLMKCCVKMDSTQPESKITVNLISELVELEIGGNIDVPIVKLVESITHNLSHTMSVKIDQVPSVGTIGANGVIVVTGATHTVDDIQSTVYVPTGEVKGQQFTFTVSDTQTPTAPPVTATVEFIVSQASGDNPTISFESPLKIPVTGKIPLSGVTYEDSDGDVVSFVVTGLPNNLRLYVDVPGTPQAVLNVNQEYPIARLAGVTLEAIGTTNTPNQIVEFQVFDNDGNSGTGSLSYEIEQPVQTTKQKLGFNLPDLTYNELQPFINNIRTGTRWGGHMEDNSFGGISADQIEVDSNFYPVKLPVIDGEEKTIYMNIFTGTDFVKSGKYIVQYEGDVVVEYKVGGSKINNESVPGRDVITFNPNANGIFIEIPEMNPDNPIRNLSVVHEDDLADFEAGKVYKKEFIDLVKQFDNLRFMDWTRTNHSKVSTWDERGKLEDLTYSNNLGGIPLEHLVLLANEAQIDPWFTIPHMATDDFITRYATYVKDNLDPNLTAYFEYSNEIWNASFSQYDWLADYAQQIIPGASNQHQQIEAYKSYKMAEIIRQVFNDDSRLNLVISTQKNAPGREQSMLQAVDLVQFGITDVASMFDSLGITTYFDTNTNDWTKQQFRDLIDNSVDGGVEFLLGEIVKDQDRIINELFPHYHQVGIDYGLDIVAYEGGSHAVSIRPTHNEPGVADLFESLHETERMGEFYTRIFDAWDSFDNFGVQNLFSLMGPWGKYGSWGHWRYYGDMTPRLQAVLDYNAQLTP